MAVKLSPPPRQQASELQWEQWYESLWRRVRPNPTTSGDAAHTIGSTSTYHGVTALTAPRTLTLPAANDLLDGEELVIQDESGDAGTHTITISSAGSDTINGGNTVSISGNYGRRTLIKRGDGAWFSA